MDLFPYIGEQFQELFLAFVNLFWGPADQFKSPWFLILLLLIPIYIFWYTWWYAPRRLIVNLSYDPKKLAPARLDLSILRVLPQVFNILALVFAIIALARPIAAFD
ncbi:MAG: hypothetical protein AAF570_19310, partial [Bacteroidota bacterium]